MNTIQKKPAKDFNKNKSQVMNLNSIKRFYLTIRLVVSPRKPLAFLATLNNYLKTKIFKKTVLRGVDIVTNYSCNLACGHCNIHTMVNSKKEELTLDDYREIEKQCTKLGVFQYCFTGGEPLLRKDFEKIVNIFKPYKRVMLVQSNGQLVNSLEKARWLKKIGIDILNVSLDSGIAKEHNTNRGVENQYNHVVQAIRFAQQAGLQIIIGTVLSHSNLHSLGIQKLIDFSNKNSIVLLINLAVPTGKWYKNKKILLTQSDRLYIRKLVKKYPVLRLDMDSTIKQYGCPAFKEKLYITPYGDVTGCTFVQISFGNIREKSLGEIRNLALKTNLMNKYSKECYAAEKKSFIDKYMSQLGENVPKNYREVM